MHLRRAVFLFIIMMILPFLSHSGSTLHPEGENIVIEDFNKTGDTFFREWKNRDTSDSPWQVYYLLNENGKKFLRGSTERNPDLSIQIGKVVSGSWNIYSHPVMSWEWRVYSIPANASESRSSTNDSAAGLYVLFQRKKVPMLSSRYQPVNWIKYVWSSTLPVGTVIPRRKVKSGVTLYEGRYVVVATGKKELGKWISFRRDVLADYRNLYGGNPVSNPLMVAILTDSDKTNGKAVADYADIRAWKH